MSGLDDLILDTEQARKQWAWGFHDAIVLLPECHPYWLDKMYRILSSDNPGEWPDRLGWDYNPYNEGLILGLYGLIALQRLDQAK